MHKLCCFILLLALADPLANAQQKQTVGWLEKVKIFPGTVTIQAKLDTGADYSSLNAGDLEEFEKNEKKHVRFTVLGRHGHKAQLEAPVVRQAWVKTHTGKHQKRNVILLGICVGSVYLEADVNLVDRSNFRYPLLVGRNFMAGNLVIDPASSYTREPNCRKPGAPEA